MAAGHLASAQASSDEPLADVRVEGNRRVESEAIVRRLGTRKGKPVDRKTIREDLKVLYRLGYFDYVEVRLLDAVEAGADGPVVVFRVVEKPAVREVKFEGLDELSKDDLSDAVTVKAFSILDRNEIEKSRRAILDAYREKGFYLADATTRLEPVQNEAAVDVVFEVVERSKVQVKEIRFVGNHNISEAEIEAGLETREGGYFSFFSGSGTYKEDAFDRDVMRISGFYYDRGYINVNVGKPRVALSPDRRFIYITVPIEEGEQYRVGALDVQGDLIAERDELLQALTMKSGDLFVRARLGTDILALQQRYRDAGFAYANITPLTNIHPKERTIDIALDVTKGKKVYIERIEIRGNTRTRDKVIRREFRVAEGDQYSGSKIRSSQQRVTALGYFESVDIATRPGSGPESIILEFVVKEKPTGTFQVGAGLSTGEGLLITAQIAHDNLFGRGQSGSFSWQFSRRRNIFSLNFTEPYFLDSRWTFAFGAHNTTADYLDFFRVSRGGSLTWGYQLIDRLRLFLTYTLEDIRVSSDSGGAPLGFFNSGVTSSAKLTMSYDTRDNRLFPTRGMYHTLSAEHAPGWGGPNFSQFSRLSATARYFHPLLLGAVFRVKGELGYITGADFPGSERYYLGGVFSLRGYPLRDISPTVVFPQCPAADCPTAPFRIGGDKQALFNLEIEFPLVDQIGFRGVVFYDLGNAYASNERWFEDRQHDLPLGMFHSVGFGVRWFSPIGPLRFEWGIPLTPRPEDKKIRFEFMVGNVF